MRTILLAIIITASLAAGVDAQNITYRGENVSLATVLDDISAEHDLYFSYSNNSLPQESISVLANDESLESFLNRLLRPHRLGFTHVDDNFIAIKPIEDLGVRLELVIVDAETKEPLEFAQLGVIGAYKGTTSNADGEINFFVEKSGQKEVKISYIGYTPYQNVATEMYVNEVDTVYLEPSEVHMEGITVTEYLNSGITVGRDASQLSIYPNKLNVLPGLSEPDALYSLQLLPGISSANESASNLNIRNGSSDQVSVYWDNIPIYHSGHYFGLVTSFIPSSVSRINVHRNVIPTEIGGSTSGVVELNAPYSTSKESDYQFNSNLTHSSASALTPFADDKALFYVAARRSFNDLLTTPTYSAYNKKLFNGTRLNESRNFATTEGSGFRNDLRFWDINAKIQYSFNQKHQLSASAFAGNNSLDFLSVNENRNTADFQLHEVKHKGINLNWKANWNTRWETNVSVSHSAYDFDFDFLFQREIGNGNQLPNSNFLATHTDEDEDCEGEDSGSEDCDGNSGDGDGNGGDGDGDGGNGDGEEAGEEEGDIEDEEVEEDLEDPNEDDELFEDRFPNAPDSLSDRGRWRNDLQNTKVRVTNTFTGNSTKLKFGGQVNLLDISYALREENAFSPDVIEGFSEEGKSYAIFGNVILGHGNKFTLDTGFRLNHFNFAGITSFDPQISARWSVTNWLTFKSSAGSYHQLIRTLRDFENTISNTSEEIWFTADQQEFPLIRNRQATLGFLIQQSGWLLDVDAYIKKLDGLTSANYNFGGNLGDDFINGEETIRGIDVLLRKRFKNYRTWISYSYSKAENFFPELADPRFPSSLDRPHRLSIVQSLSLNRLELSLGWKLATGLPFTQPQSDTAVRVEQADDNDIDSNPEGFFQINFGENNNARLPLYHRLDASAWFNFSPNPSRWVGKIGLSVLNVYGRQNVFNRRFFPEQAEAEDEEVGIIREDRFLLGFTPNVTLTLSF